MIEWIHNYIVLLSGVTGAALGGLISWRIGNRAARANRTVELFKEFYSSEMGKARIEAQDFLTANAASTYEDYARRADARAVWEVIYFYQRLSQMLSAGLLLDRVVAEWFGETFVWWWEYSFRHELRPSRWKAFHDLARLHRWLEKQRGPTARGRRLHRRASGSVALSPDAWTLWHERGRDDRAFDRKATVP